MQGMSPPRPSSTFPEALRPSFGMGGYADGGVTQMDGMPRPSFSMAYADNAGLAAQREAMARSSFSFVEAQRVGGMDAALQAAAAEAAAAQPGPFSRQRTSEALAAVAPVRSMTLQESLALKAELEEEKRQVQAKQPVQPVQAMQPVMQLQQQLVAAAVAGVRGARGCGGEGVCCVAGSSAPWPALS